MLLRAPPALFLLLVLLTTPAAARPSASSFCDPTPEWPRSFAEEFAGTALNTSRWSVYADNQKGQCGFGVGRFGRCAGENVYLEDGALVLRSDRNVSCSAAEGCFNYSSAGVTSRDKKTWSVAEGAGFRLCVSAMLPDGGAGIWPAHWMMPNDNNSRQGTSHCQGPGKNGGCSCDPDEGEIDILEMVNGNAQACGTYHWQTTWPAKNCMTPVGHESVHECTTLSKDWGSTFHEFAVEHTAEYLAFGRLHQAIESALACDL